MASAMFSKCVSVISTFLSLILTALQSALCDELNYKDLFIERDGKYWFLIAFPTINRSSQWFFGRLFLKKYNLFFNYDTKTISFYNPNLPRDDPSDKKGDTSGNKSTIIICIAAIVVLSIISVGLGIYLSKMCYKANKNKGRLNEIRENFVYETQENNNNENESQTAGINA